MSTSSGNPPVGTGNSFRHDDPAEPAEERRGNGQQDAQDRFGTLEREIPNDTATPESKVEQLIVREQGVNSFAHAEEVDRMEKSPSVRDQTTDLNTTGNIVGDTIRGVFDTIADDDTDAKKR